MWLCYSRVPVNTCKCIFVQVRPQSPRYFRELMVLYGAVVKTAWSPPLRTPSRSSLALGHLLPSRSVLGFFFLMLAAVTVAHLCNTIETLQVRPALGHLLLSRLEIRNCYSVTCSVHTQLVCFPMPIVIKSPPSPFSPFTFVTGQSVRLAS